MDTVFNKYRRTMKHGFNSAVIVDSKGDQRGTVIIRYTDATYGHNSETQLSLSLPPEHHNASKKSDSYDRSSLFYMLTELGAKCYNWQGDQYHASAQKTGRPGVSIHGVSRESDLVSFKIGNKKFRVLWVQS